MLADKIHVHEENGKLSLEICLKAPFRDHVDIYENGQQIESLASLDYDFDRLANILMEDEIEDEMEA